jgi:hypothetical protein
MKKWRGLFVGRPWQATYAGLLYRPLWTFQLWPPDAPAPTDAFRTLAAEVGTYGRRIRTGKFYLYADFHYSRGEVDKIQVFWHVMLCPLLKYGLMEDTASQETQLLSLAIFKLS